MPNSFFVEGADAAAVATVRTRIAQVLEAEGITTRLPPEVEPETVRAKSFELVRTAMQALGLFFSFESWRRQRQGKPASARTQDLARVAEKLVTLAREAQATSRVTIRLETKGKSFNLSIETVPAVLEQLSATVGE